MSKTLSAGVKGKGCAPWPIRQIGRPVLLSPPEQRGPDGLKVALDTCPVRLHPLGQPADVFEVAVPTHLLADPSGQGVLSIEAAGGEAMPTADDARLKASLGLGDPL